MVVWVARQDGIGGSRMGSDGSGRELNPREPKDTGPTKAAAFSLLVNKGPQPAGELPYSYVSPEQRRDGVTKFDPKSGNHHNPSESGGKPVPVYYIEGKHSPEIIVQKWLESNEEVVEKRGEKSIHHLISSSGDGFREASRDALGPFEQPHMDGNDHARQGGECPVCGKEYDGLLPDHLPECDGA